MVMPNSRRSALTWVKAARAAVLVMALFGANLAHAQSVFMEDLTWPELRERVASGSVIAIVPTGGTEQGGPHLALGKHNFIVREAAGRIARGLGTALVAPVIAVVPEGSLERPAGNLLFPGTLALSDDTFARVLRDVATSLALSGFRIICFLGDHGQSQTVQQSVAKQLGAAWSARGIRVLNVSSYYSPAADDRELERLDLARATLGDHGGIADTAQLMTVRPEAVRLDRRAPESWQRGVPSGASGRPELATSELGARLLQRRIDAAVAEIRRLAP